jgi:hypothetical protein
MTHRSAPALLLAGLVCVLAACSGPTDVSLTGNTPARYSHVWITTQEVWFHTSATAGPDDGGWRKFPLSTPATIDLVQQNGGNLGSVVTGLKVTPGTYSQVRLIPVDPSVALTTSAQEAGAIYNAEADYVDGDGTTHQLPLELLNPDQGIGIATSLRVPPGDVGAAVGAVSIGSTSATGDAAFMPATSGTLTPTTTGTTTTPTTTSTGTTTTRTTGTTSTTTTAPPNQFAISFDGARDLVPFSFTTASGAPTAANAILLSPHASGYDLTQVGAISGTLTLSNLTGISSTSGLPQIQASAEVLSADGTRHEVVSSTPVQSDGSFMLYPLATGTTRIPAEYDVVIHGPGIATIIIKTVQVFQSSSSTTPVAATNGSTSGTTGSTTGTTNSTTSTTSNTTITPVSVGTLVPRAATSFSAALAPGAAALPAGAAVSFYQTLARSGELPYVIETSPIDPFNQVMANAQALSMGTIDSGTWSSTGSSVTLVSAAPAERAGNYLVAATAPSYADGALTTKIAAPAAGTTPVSFTLSAMTLASDTTLGTIAASITLGTQGKYDQGELLISHNGTLVVSSSLASVFASGGGTVILAAVPAGTPAAVYYVSVRAWNSQNASIALQRQFFPGALDMSSSPSGRLQLTVN